MPLSLYAHYVFALLDCCAGLMARHALDGCANYVHCLKGTLMYEMHERVEEFLDGPTVTFQRLSGK